MKRISSFILLFGVWLLLAWPFRHTADGIETDWSIILIGAVAVLVASLLFRHSSSEGIDLPGFLNPARLFWLIVYVFVFIYSVIRANLDVAYRILHPAMPIHPGIVRVRTNLRTPAGITLLANSIALTPGTLTVHAGEDGVLYVHWINVRATDEEGATRFIVRRFEWFIKRILE